MVGHGKQWARILRMGENGGDWNERKCRETYVKTSSKISVLKGFPKDHKVAADEEVGPPMRPVCGASEGINAELGELLGEILDVLAEEEDRENGGLISDSTEDMCARFEEVNKELEKEENRGKKFVIGSLDVEALYPSLEAERLGVLVREMVERSKVKIAVNERELKLYLASTMEENEVKEEGWEEFVHKKKNKSKNKAVAMKGLTLGLLHLHFEF